MTPRISCLAGMKRSKITDTESRESEFIQPNTANTDPNSQINELIRLL